MTASANKSKFVVWNNIALIPLINTFGRFAIVDAKNLDIVGQHNWSLSIRDGSPVTIHNGRTFTISRLITRKKYIDHIDRNKLNNLESNFRQSTHQQNCFNKDKQSNNTSGFIGVSFDNRDKLWIGELRKNGKRVLYIRCKTKEEAAKARDKAALMHFGKFAVLNFN